jgi:TonB family protein
MLTSIRLFVALLTSGLVVCHPFTAYAATPVAAGDVCAQPATTIKSAPVEMPLFAGLYHLTGITDVQVDLDRDGNVLGTWVRKTSGASQLDNAALLAARNSTFRPEIRDCVPVGGSYLYIVDFSQE